MPLTFKLFNNPEMTQSFTDAANNKRLVQNLNANAGTVDMTAYFGSPNAARKLQAASNPGVDPVQIQIVDTLPKWQANTAYSLGQDIEPTSPNGVVYRCTAAGASAATQPSWPLGINSAVADGTAKWTALAKKHAPADVKLALSQAGLDAATGGAPLNLGVTINGGAAIAVYVRMGYPATDIFDTNGQPEVSLQLSLCTESAK